MTKRPATAEPWDAQLFGAGGAILGIVIATILHLLHDHSQLTPDEILWQHFFPRMLAAMAAGAIVVGGGAAIRNWLKRRS